MKKLNFDSIIFDMDGVLVNNSSYCTAIQQTVSRILAVEKNIRTVIPREYIETIKGITGFNNDWDTSFALIQLLGNRTPVNRFRTQVQQITPEIRQTPSYKNVKDVFQAMYLGEALFRTVYGYAPPVKRAKGLITQETLLIDPSLLKKLAYDYRLGIATSRPRFEAIYAANSLNLIPAIPKGFVVAKEDVPREKPFPDPLLEAKRRMGTKNPLYIGDTINDVVAAKRAGMPCIYVGRKSLGTKRIRQTNELWEVLYE